MLSLLVLASLAAAPPPPSASAFRWTERGVDVDVILDSLSVEQKVGQLMLVGFGGTQMDGTIATFLDEVRPGGVALFSRNIDSRAQTARLIGAVRAHDPVARTRTGDTAVPLFVAVDQEGGNVVRLKNDALVLPSAMALGAANDVGWHEPPAPSWARTCALGGST